MPVSALLARTQGSSGPPKLADELRRITEWGIINIPDDLFLHIINATHNEDGRRHIMQHLRECLSEPAGNRWKRVYAGLALAEKLVQSGSPELMVETAEGRHFDLVQRLSFLEHFERSSDRTAQNLVRKKAAALRADVVPLIQSGGLREPWGGDMKDNLSTCSPKTASTTSTLTSLSSDMPVPAPRTPAGPVVVNGIVTVGHSEDTTSGSSDEGEGALASRRGRQRTLRKASDRRRPAAAGPKVAEQAAAAPAPRGPAATVDLLGL